MNSRAKARAERMQTLLDDDGTVTPAEQLPAGLLIQEGELEMEYAEALTAADTWERLKLVCSKI
ncbi:hypothetical protein [Deinococcus sp. AJ005]|uniref:hypothetical protein n=1 Tax=Deinococcus sp. AJ005 TaxID=2652443 RepID=UPI00125CB3EE|nr:hypothetical protein [Deinococcus sp. AJ005]QFP76823.1 hypothetical protein DAAJ005_10420 [Deinococcus sp. AJ005]